jgi:hypothetical protein
MNQCEDYAQMNFFETWNLKSIFGLIKMENKTLFDAYIIIIVGINVFGTSTIMNCSSKNSMSTLHQTF